jgi:hypothetical protein
MLEEHLPPGLAVVDAAKEASGAALPFDLGDETGSPSCAATEAARLKSRCASRCRCVMLAMMPNPAMCRVYSALGPSRLMTYSDRSPRIMRMRRCIRSDDA